MASLFAMMARWTKLAEVLGVNSLPVVGVFAGDWSSTTALTVYWFENLVASVLIGLRLWLHRRWAAGAADGHAAVSIAKPPGEFLITAILFTLAHGVMLGALFLMVTKVGPDLGHLRQAVVGLLAMQGTAFAVDLWSLPEWPPQRMNDRADHLLGRVVLVHLSIIVGMFAFAWLERPGSFFAFFVGCKVLSDLSQFLPRVDQGTPDAPPRWLLAVSRYFPTRNGETFQEYWVRTHRTGQSGPPVQKATRSTRRR